MMLTSKLEEILNNFETDVLELSIRGEIPVSASNDPAHQKALSALQSEIKAREVAARIDELHRQYGWQIDSYAKDHYYPQRIAALQAELDELTADAATDRDTTDKGSEGRKTDA